MFVNADLLSPPGPNLTKVGTSPLLEWGRPTSPLQWTNGDGSRWRLSAGGATCRRTAAASAWMGQASYEGAVAMRALSFKSRTQQMRSYAECIACIVTAPLFGPVAQLGRSSCNGATWKVAPLGMRHLCPHYTVIQLRFKTCLKLKFRLLRKKHSLTIFNDVAWTGIKKNSE